MATEIMSRDVTPVPVEELGQPVPKPRENLDQTWRDIVSKARTAPAPALGAIGLSAASGLSMWAAFTPLDWSPLGWLCLVPLIVLVRLPRRTAWMYTACYVSGLVYSLAVLQWMRLGDPTMYIAWIALAVYLALYFPAFVWLSRVAVHRFSLPLILAVPALWVGLEYARGHLMTGFSWYYLGHTQHNWIELIQIGDLVGAYGVSFIVAMMSACLAGLVPHSWLTRLRLLPEAAGIDEGDRTIPPLRKPALQVAVCLGIFAAALSYGYIRRSQAEFTGGPRVALIQGNFTSSLKHDPNEWNRIYRTHERLTGLAVKHQPDVVIWPETMFRHPLFELSPDTTDEQLLAAAPNDPNFDKERWIETWRSPQVRRMLADMSRMAGAAMIIGIEAVEPAGERIRNFNSAAFVRPDVGLANRYDKMHRVIFGEYIPLRDELPWLHRLTPFSSDYGIAAGDTATVFEYGNWRFAPIICFEDTVPHLVRGIVKGSAGIGKGGKPVDCLVNLTNDGWFHGSSELDQHLITAKFRAVECRTPLVRAVNTGISAVVDGDGVVVEPDVFIDGDGERRDSMSDPQTGRWHKQLNAAIVDTVPLDNRHSLYIAWGDWFAASCCLLAVGLFIGNFLPRRRANAQLPTAVL